MSGGRPAGRGRRRAALAATGDSRFAGRRVHLAPDVRLRGDLLVDDHLGEVSTLVGLGPEVVGALAHGDRDVDDVCAALVERFPDAPVERDVLALLRRLNDSGLVVAGPRYAGWLTPLPLPSPLHRALEVVLDAAVRLLCVRRRRFVGPLRYVALTAAAAAALLPLTAVLVGVVVLGAVATGSDDLVRDVVASAGAVLLSVVAHEVAHAVALGRSRVVALTSTASVRVLAGGVTSGRHAVAALAGPLTGLVVAVGALVVAARVQAPVAALVAVALCLSHAWCLLPWSADGRALLLHLRQDDGGTVAAPAGP